MAPDEEGNQPVASIRIDLIAPDGLGRSGAITTGKLQTLQIPGGTQALKRIEVVEIVVDGRAVALRRPTLIAAILLRPARCASIPGQKTSATTS